MFVAVFFFVLFGYRKMEATFLIDWLTVFRWIGPIAPGTVGAGRLVGQVLVRLAGDALPAAAQLLLDHLVRQSSIGIAMLELWGHEVKRATVYCRHTSRTRSSRGHQSGSRGKRGVASSSIF